MALFNRFFFPIAAAALLLGGAAPAPAQTAPAQTSPVQTAPAQISPAPVAPPGTLQPATPPRPINPYGSNITIRIGGENSAPFTFFPPRLQYLSQAYVKLTGVDLGDNKLVDDFAAINYCKILTDYYSNEFAWRRGREAVRTAITRNLESYPEYFYIVGTLPLGRYDFDKKAFMLDTGHQMQRTGVFRITHYSYDCSGHLLSMIPVEYSFRLTNPITLEEIDIPEDQAFTITRSLEQSGNAARTVFAVFYLRVNDFSTIRAGSVTSNDARSANVRATLMSMRLYLDREHKYQIFEYTGD